MKTGRAAKKPQTMSEEKATGNLAILQAAYADKPVRLDGALDDRVWKKAPAYNLALATEQVKQGKNLAERGRMRLVWNRRFLYLGVDFDDSDVVAEGGLDGQHHYTLGDVAELFLWPEDYTWYWELYVTPAGRQSTFFFPGGGRVGLPSHFQQHFGMEVAARVDGTLNDWRDRDRRWTAVMAVPVNALTARGEGWGPGSRWRVFVGRYNYSRYLPTREHSMCPPLPQLNYHLRESYARLEFLA